MKELTFVTGNPGKLREVQEILAPYGIRVVGKRMDLREVQSISAREVIERKVLEASHHFRHSFIVEDTGIYFKDFQDFPGVFTRFVAKTLGNSGIQKLLNGTSREAFFQTIVAYHEKGHMEFFEGKCEGKIVEKEISDEVFRKDPLPYDLIFMPHGESRTFSAMTLQEKNKFNHRAKAFRKFAEWFQQKE